MTNTLIAISGRADSLSFICWHFQTASISIQRWKMTFLKKTHEKHLFPEKCQCTEHAVNSFFIGAISSAESSSKETWKMYLFISDFILIFLFLLLWTCEPENLKGNTVYHFCWWFFSFSTVSNWEYKLNKSKMQSNIQITTIKLVSTAG